MNELARCRFKSRVARHVRLNRITNHHFFLANHDPSMRVPPSKYVANLQIPYPIRRMNQSKKRALENVRRSRCLDRAIAIGIDFRDRIRDVIPFRF